MGFMLRKIGFQVCLLLLAGVCLGDEVELGKFNYDPQLAGESVPGERAQATTPIPFDASVTERDVRLTTKSPIAPYLEAVGGPEPTADELRLLPDRFRDSPLERYQLGAGIGIAVEDKASLSLGYRFNQPLSLLDDNRQTTLSEREDLRIFFDLKLPFN